MRGRLTTTELRVIRDVLSDDEPGKGGGARHL